MILLLLKKINLFRALHLKNSFNSIFLLNKKIILCFGLGLHTTSYTDTNIDIIVPVVSGIGFISGSLLCGLGGLALWYFGKSRKQMSTKDATDLSMTTINNESTNQNIKSIYTDLPDDVETRILDQIPSSDDWMVLKIYKLDTEFVSLANSLQNKICLARGGDLKTLTDAFGDSISQLENIVIECLHLQQSLSRSGEMNLPEHFKLCKFISWDKCIELAKSRQNIYLSDEAYHTFFQSEYFRLLQIESMPPVINESVFSLLKIKVLYLLEYVGTWF